MYITSRGPSCVIYIAFCGEEKYKTRGTAGLGKVDTFLIRHPVVWRLTETVHRMTTALKYKQPIYPDESLGPQRKGKNVANILAGKTLGTRIMKQSSPNALHMEVGFNHQNCSKNKTINEQKHMSSSIVLTYPFFLSSSTHTVIASYSHFLDTSPLHLKRWPRNTTPQVVTWG